MENVQAKLLFMKMEICFTECGKMIKRTINDQTVVEPGNVATEWTPSPLDIRIAEFDASKITLTKDGFLVHEDDLKSANN